MKSLKLFSLSLAVALFTGCTTLVEQAADQLERGDALGAVDTYSKALVRAPEDPEAKVGLSRARRKSMSRTCRRTSKRKAGRFAFKQMLR